MVMDSVGAGVQEDGQTGQRGGERERNLPMDLYQLLLIPVFVQVGLTFALLFWLGPARVGALRRGEVKLKDVALGQSAWPDPITQIANAHNNQYQLPVLFYVVVLLALVTRKADMVLAAAAWLFVGSRIVHAWVYVTHNNVPSRFRAYVVGAFTLVAMWVWLAFRVIVEGA